MKFALSFGSVGFVLAVFASLFRIRPMSAPRGLLPGAWDDRVTALAEKAK